MTTNLKSADNPTPVVVPNKGQRIRAYEIPAVEVPNEGVVGTVTHVDLDNSGFSFLPDEPDPTRNRSEENARTFVQRWKVLTG